MQTKEKHNNHSFSVVVVFYNEKLYIERTLVSWLNQTRQPDQIICVDNGSTDGSIRIAKQILEGSRHIKKVFLSEPKPGKIHALEAGCRAVTSEFVALSDADTYYPPHYLEMCEALFSGSDEKLSALMAQEVYGDPSAFFSRFMRGYFVVGQKIQPKHTFTGGYGQVFRMQALVDAGGFSEEIWPYVLLDHEIMYRIFKKGNSLYHMDLWCKPSLRRKNRDRTRWNILERILYMLVPYSLQGWFFYRFLGPRFKKRGLLHLRLREKPWESKGKG